MQPVFQLTPNPPNSAPRVPRLQWWETVCQVQGIDFKNHWWCHRVSQKRGPRGAREPCSSLTYDSLRVGAESLHGPRDFTWRGREGREEKMSRWTNRNMDTEKLGPDCLDSQMRSHSTPETQSVYYVQLDRGVELLHTAASRRQGSWCAAESRNHPNLSKSSLSL